MRPFIAVSLVTILACDTAPEADNTRMVAASDANSGLNRAIANKVVIGATLKTIANANLRDGPSPNALVLRIVPSKSEVVVTGSASPAHGFYYVTHNGLPGWMNGQHLDFVKAPAVLHVDIPPDEPQTPDPPPTIQPPPAVTGPLPPITPPPQMATHREEAIVRAQTGLGFSYWWGGSRWDPLGVTESNAGTCVGVCGDCTHTGQWGADCSGYVAKIWQVPPGNDDIRVANHKYTTVNFTYETHEWSTIDRGDMQLADAFTYNIDGKGHIFLYESGDAWGQVWAYEAKGCAIGIVHNLRSVSSSYKAIRRDGY